MSQGKAVQSEDAVDILMKRWTNECPELDLSGTGVVGRILRLNYYVARAEDATLANHSMHLGEFNLLAALRRAGPPYQLAPNQLQSHLLVSSGALTNRIDQLERAGLVKRVPDPIDRRSVQIKLTPTGKRTVDEAILDVLSVEREVISVLNASECKQLASLLKRLTMTFENGKPTRRSKADPR